ncbi:hypothetical protein TNCV_503861 [Trichonephila clavipes]|nr:hypothetical protein TNCV_503861 [Trichonephila clavipes]
MTHVKSVEAQSSPVAVLWKFGEEVPAQVLSSPFDCGSKLRGGPKVDLKKEKLRDIYFPQGFLQKEMKVTWCEIRTDGGCRRSQPRVAMWFCIATAECALAMSSNNRTPDLRNPGRFF